ncbi:MAG TPA: hypothetical protein DDW85_07060 [Porphyromonadaceae bacterium]|nr:hypothetical protein [Porphyromonadaceae bacterium]
MKTETESVFMQMHNGTRTGEGSFYVGLQKLFYLADQSNRRKLVEAFPDFFGDEVPEFGIYTERKVEIKETAKQESDKNIFTQTGLSDKKMNIHLHLKEITRQNLEESLRHSEEMISNLYPLIYEMLQKHQDNTQQGKNARRSVFRFLLQFQKYGIEVLSSQSRDALTDATDLYDRY